MTPTDHCASQPTRDRNGHDTPDARRASASGKRRSRPFATGADDLAANELADNFDPTEVERHWRDAYRSRPYVTDEFTFDDYGPAYRYGGQSWLGRAHRSCSFDDVEHEIASGWEYVKAESRLTWEQTKDAVRDGWDHLAGQSRRASLRADDDGMASAANPSRATSSRPDGPTDAEHDDDTRPLL